MLDAWITELYLFTIAIVIAKLIPAVLSVNIWLYVIVAVVWLLIIMVSIFKKDNQKWKMVDWFNNFKNLSVWKLSVYKLLVFVVALIVLKLIPAMMTVDIAWYVAIAFFGMGYVVVAMFRK